MMSRGVFYSGVRAILFLLAPLLFIACGGDGWLSRPEVEEIVREELADAPAPPQPEPGLTSADVEDSIRAALAAMPRLEPGLTAAEAERIARSVVASIPPTSAPVDYTKFFVNNAISRYETQGLDATLAYYNRPESIDGQWYVFIIDENDLVIGHPDAHRMGLEVKGWVGTDATGYNFGPDMLSATEDGKWVSYVFRNPESGSLGPDHTGALEYKHVWVMRHNGLLFASGWYVIADEFTKSLVFAAVGKFRSAGLAATIEYCNSAETVEGEWFAFIADSSGTIVDHYNKALVGTDLKDLLGTDIFEATAEGNVAFHSTACTASEPATGDAPARSTSNSQNQAIVACGTPGATLTATLLQRTTEVDTTTCTVTVTPP